MDVREKLVELLNEIIDGGFKWHNYLYESGEQLNNDDIASSLIANGVTVQEWVSVEDRLPKPFENVIVFRDGKISIDYNEGNGWFAYDFNGKRVTHWMPIPQPPKGGNMK